MGTRLIIKGADFYDNRIYGDDENPMVTEIETTTTGAYLNNSLQNTTLSTYDIVNIPIPAGCTSITINIYCGSVAYSYFINSSDAFAGVKSPNILSVSKSVPTGAQYLHLSYEARRKSQTISQYVIFSDGIHSYKLNLPTT